MSYKILRISRYYSTSIQKTYENNPSLAQQDYNSQLDALLWQAMTAGNAYSVAFRSLGYESQEIIANAELAQRQWGKENGFPADIDSKSLLIEQIAAVSPEILLVFGGASILQGHDIDYLRERCPELRLCVVFTDAPTQDYSAFFAYDLVISNTPELVRYYSEQGLPIHHVHYGFDPQVLERINTDAAQTIDFGFAGSIITQDGYHQQRAGFLSEIVRQTNLQIWSSAARLKRTDIYKKGIQIVAYDIVAVAKQLGIPDSILKALPLVKKVARWEQRPRLAVGGLDWRVALSIQPPLYGLKMFQLMHDTRVTLNNHIDVSANSATNMRLFEATGVQSCLLTDWKDDLATLYEPEIEVVTYRSAEEAIEKARYLIENPTARQEIARAGQKRTLRDHTYQRRVEQLDYLIHEWFRNKS